MKTKKVIVVLSLATVVFLGLSLQAMSQTKAPAAAPSKAQAWKFSNYLPPPHWSNWCNSWLLDAIEKRTNGKIKVRLFVAEALGKAAEHYNMVSSGRVEIGETVTGFAPGTFPLAGVLQLPFTWKNSLEGSMAANDLFQKGFLDETLRKDVKLIGLNLTVPLKIWTKKPVDTLEGLRGLRLRVAGGLDIQTVEALGANAIAMPLPEVYPALEKGVIDGGVYGYDNAAVFKYAEAVKNVMDVPAGYAVHMYIMNKKLWDSLPKNTQVVLEGVFKDAAIHWANTYDGLDADYKQDVIKHNGVVVANVSPAEYEKMRAATARVKDGWIADMKNKGLPGQENYDALQTTMKDLGIIPDQSWVKNRAMVK